jgi:hypothetical protein
MRIQVEPEPNESERICSAILASSLPPSRAGWVIFPIALLIGVASGFFSEGAWLLTIALTTLGVVAVVYALQTETRWRSRRGLVRDPHVNEPYQIEIDAAGIRVWCDHIDTRYTWNGITKAVETADYYLLLRGPNGGPAIPKRLLDEETEKELRRRIGEWSPEGGLSLAQVKRAAASTG